VTSSQSHFDKRAGSWDQNQQLVERNRAIAGAIRDMLPSLQHIRAMEYGAGTGLLTAELVDEFDGLVALDTSSGMLLVLRRKMRRRASVTVLNHDLSLHDLEQEPFDLIYSAMTLHHVEHIEVLLERCRRLLRPGGYLAVADLEEEDGSFHGDPTIYFHAGFRPSLLAEMLERTGFVEVRHRRVYTMRKMVGGGMKEYPVFLMVARRG
jgi:ubiquinone/menaquinone biosynthesis C-methylase UbiE